MEREIKGTKIITVDPAHPASEGIAAGAALLRRGELVAFPTETVYGLGANALDAAAAARIYAAKGRPSDNPLIVHIAAKGAVAELAREIPEVAQKLMDAFWPGPLTLVLPRLPHIPDVVTGGLETVAIRMPSHPVAMELIRQAGVPVAAPSANLSGRPSPTTAEHVIHDLAGRIAAIIDGGPTGVGLESTVVDITTPVPMVLRPGGVTVEELRTVVGEVGLDPTLMTDRTHERPRSPGMKYRHYAPKAPMTVVEGPVAAVAARIAGLVAQYQRQGKKVGVLASDETAGSYRADVVLSLGTRENLEEIAANLYHYLRLMDGHGVDVILAEGFAERGIGLAIMNRMRKAAGHKIVKA